MLQTKRFINKHLKKNTHVADGLVERFSISAKECYAKLTFLLKDLPS